MFSRRSDKFRMLTTQGLFVLALMLGMGLSYGVTAANDYFSLKTVFPSGKCSPVIPHYELMFAGFAGGEFTRFKIHDDNGEVVEVISAFVNKDRDQWAIVGSKADSEVIFCLYASGVGKGSVHSQTIKQY